MKNYGASVQNRVSQFILPKISLADRIDRAAEKWGEKTAIISAEPRFPSEFPEKMNFVEIAETTKRLASGFARRV